MSMLMPYGYDNISTGDDSMCILLIVCLYMYMHIYYVYVHMCVYVFYVCSKWSNEFITLYAQYNTN